MRNVWFGQKSLKGKKEFYVWPNLLCHSYQILRFHNFTRTDRSSSPWWCFILLIWPRTDFKNTIFYDVNVCYILLERYEQCAFHFQCEWTYFNVSEFSDKAHKSSRSLAFKGRMRVLAFMLLVEHNTFLESSCIEMKIHMQNYYDII